MINPEFFLEYILLKFSNYTMHCVSFCRTKCVSDGLPRTLVTHKVSLVSASHNKFI